MKIKNNFIFYILFGMILNNSLAYAEEKEFYVFDAMTYLEKPSLYSEGLTKANVIYQQFLYDDRNFKELPPYKKVSSYISKLKGSCNIILDIEKWPLFKGGSLNYNNLQQHVEFTHYVKSLKSVGVGYYGLVPIRDYHSSISLFSYRRDKWEDKNSQLSPLVSAVDVLYPSLYTFYNKPEKWKEYAISMLTEAKRVAKGKKVYAFLWPRFHESNRRLKNQWVPADFWRLQLETVYAHADGIVIWGGWDLHIKKKLKWNNQWAWWRETQGFVNELHMSNKLFKSDCESLTK